MTDAASPSHAAPAIELTAAGVPRLDSRRFMAELASELIGTDRGLRYTCGELLLRPGLTIRRYVIERDPRLTRPIRFLLITLALATLAAQFAQNQEAYVGGFLTGLGQGMRPGSPPVQQAFSWYFQHLSWVLVACWAPAVGGTSQSLYKRSRLNLAEALTFGTYTLGLMLLLQLPTLLLPLPPEITVPWSILAATLPILVANLGYHRSEGYGWAHAVGSVIAAYLFVLLMFIGLMMATVVVFILGS